jgi:hypothetical protein
MKSRTDGGRTGASSVISASGRGASLRTARVVRCAGSAASSASSDTVGSSGSTTSAVTIPSRSAPPSS